MQPPPPNTLIHPLVAFLRAPTHDCGSDSCVAFERRGLMLIRKIDLATAETKTLRDNVRCKECAAREERRQGSKEEFLPLLDAIKLLRKLPEIAVLLAAHPDGEDDAQFAYECSPRFTKRPRRR